MTRASTLSSACGAGCQPRSVTDAGTTRRRELMMNGCRGAVRWSNG